MFAEDNADIQRAAYHWGLVAQLLETDTDSYRGASKPTLKVAPNGSRIWNDWNVLIIMANIQIKRGQQTQVSIKFKPDGISATRNFYTNDAQYTASLVLRKKTGSSVSGEKIDTLISLTPASDDPGASPPVIQSTHGRIRFLN